MQLEAIEAFGMSLAVIIYLLVERGGKVKLLTTPRIKFLTPGIIALIAVALFYLAQSPKPPLYEPFVKWLGLWVASLMVHSMVKQNQSTPPAQ